MTAELHKTTMKPNSSSYLFQPRAVVHAAAYPNLHRVMGEEWEPTLDRLLVHHRANTGRQTPTQPLTFTPTAS